MVLKISEVKNCLEEMRKVYPFEDDKTYLTFLTNLESGTRRTIEIETTDSATGTQVTLQREADRENLIDGQSSSEFM